MNAAAQVFEERHCPNCRRLKPAEEFRSHHYCKGCKAAYNRSRYAEMKAGTWRAKPRSEYAPRPADIIERPPLVQTVTERQHVPAIPDGAEAQLRAAIEAFMREFGFTALRVTYTRLEGEVAKRRRLDLAREGWIA